MWIGRTRAARREGRRRAGLPAVGRRESDDCGAAPSAGRPGRLRAWGRRWRSRWSFEASTPRRSVPTRAVGAEKTPRGPGDRPVSRGRRVGRPSHPRSRTSRAPVVSRPSRRRSARPVAARTGCEAQPSASAGPTSVPSIARRPSVSAPTATTTATATIRPARRTAALAAPRQGCGRSPLPARPRGCRLLRAGTSPGSTRVSSRFGRAHFLLQLNRSISSLIRTLENILAIHGISSLLFSLRSQLVRQ